MKVWPDLSVAWKFGRLDTNEHRGSWPEQHLWYCTAVGTLCPPPLSWRYSQGRWRCCPVVLKGKELFIAIFFKNDNPVFMVGAHTKQINKTYCRQWCWDVSHILVNRVGALLHNRALARSCCWYGQTKSGHQFWFLAGPSSISPDGCLWMYFCMLLAGPHFGILPPSCLELFR